MSKKQLKDIADSFWPKPSIPEKCSHVLVVRNVPNAAPVVYQGTVLGFAASGANVCYVLIRSNDSLFTKDRWESVHDVYEVSQ